MNASLETLKKTPNEMLVESLHQVAEGMKKQTEAINRLAESNESLAAVLYQSYADEVQDELPPSTYLSGKLKG